MYLRTQLSTIGPPAGTICNVPHRCKIPLVVVGNYADIGILGLFPERLVDPSDLMPVTEQFLFRLQWRLFYGQPQLFHLVNIVLHGIVTFLVLKLFQLIEKELKIKQAISFIGTIVFAIHPVHTEAVANITCQAELLSAFFLLLGLIFYLTWCEKLSFSRIFLLCFLAVASLVSKEQGIVLLPICSVLSLTINRRSHFFPLVLISGTLAFCRMRIGGAPQFTSLDNPAAFVESFPLRWLSFAWQWLLHLKLLIAPFQLCFDYSMGCISPIVSFMDPRNGVILFCGLLLIGVVYTTYKNTKKEHQKLIIIGSLFSLISFFPASNILLTVGFPIAERVLYLPSIGFSLLIGVLWKSLEKINGKLDSHAFVLISIALVLCLQRSFEWTTELNLYASGLKVCPTNAKIHYNLAKILADKGKMAEAEREYREAIKLHPQYEQALNNLGNLLEKKGHFNESEQFLRAAVARRPEFSTAWMNLGITMMNAGKFNESIHAFEESLKYRPNSADCFFNLGNLFQKIGELEKAADAWRNAVSLKLSHCPAWTNLLVALDELNRCSAISSLEELSLRHCSSMPALRSQLGICHVQLKNYSLAEEHLLTAIALAPTSHIYRSNYDVFLQLRLKKYPKNTKTGF